MKKPSVTKLIDLLNKPALVNWANRIGLQGVDVRKYRKEVMGEGKKYHKEIENFLKKKEPFSDPEMQEEFECFFSDSEILGSEKKIETDYFVGVYDIKFKDNFTETTFLCDFKLNKKQIYLAQKLQLVAYQMAEPVDEIGIISINPPFFDMILVDIEDFTPYEELLINLSNVYRILEENNERL